MKKKPLQDGTYSSKRANTPKLKVKYNFSRHLAAQVVLNFLREFRKAHPYPPTRREIAAGCNLPVTSVTKQLHYLQDTGKIIVEEGIARGIILVDDE